MKYNMETKEVIGTPEEIKEFLKEQRKVVAQKKPRQKKSKYHVWSKREVDKHKKEIVAAALRGHKNLNVKRIARELRLKPSQVSSKASLIKRRM